MEILKHGKEYNENISYPHAEVKKQKCKCGCVFKYSGNEIRVNRIIDSYSDIDYPLFFELVVPCPECFEIIPIERYDLEDNQHETKSK